MAFLRFLHLKAAYLYTIILLGLGSLHGTTAVVSEAAIAAPYKFVPEYILPDYSKLPLRERRPAHLDNDDKYKKAMTIMRSLPKEHPHSLVQQAALHCAYCDSSCELEGFLKFKLQVHDNWLFFPFHRWYLYFFEKILGKLLDDETFALPFWNWDAPDGMSIPEIFADKNSSLYDKLRNEAHYKLKVDLNYSKKVSSPIGDELIKNNERVMYTQMVSGATTPQLFFGKAYQGGHTNDVKSPGTIENQPHNSIHIWTGDSNQPLGEDMGRFFSAGLDPIFYSHHSNVDRMWTIWKTLPVRRRGMTREDPVDPDWLDSSFLFYDENEKLVRVKVRDCLDTEKMGYKYQKQALPWLNFKPPNPQATKILRTRTPEVFPVAFPRVMKGLLKFTVRRPKPSRTIDEKEEKEEILVIEGIEHAGDEYIKFDVFLNAEDHEVSNGPRNAAFVGTYSNVPCRDKAMVKSSRDFGITELLEVLGGDGDENVVVSLVPILGKGKFIIGGARIQLSAADSHNLSDL